MHVLHIFLCLSDSSLHHTGQPLYSYSYIDEKKEIEETEMRAKIRNVEIVINQEESKNRQRRDKMDGQCKIVNKRLRNIKQSRPKQSNRDNAFILSLVSLTSRAAT